MTLDQLLGAEDKKTVVKTLEAMSEEQLLAWFNPYLSVTRPVAKSDQKEMRPNPEVKKAKTKTNNEAMNLLHTMFEQKYGKKLKI